MTRIVQLFLLFLILAGCINNQNRKLCGKWQAVEVTEDGEQMALNASDVKLEFNSNGFYKYQSSLNYLEAGSFSIQGDLLYTLDTINKASSEKAVRILLLTRDSLTIQMMAGSRERIYRMAKVK
jgi:hypothetical protein